VSGISRRRAQGAGGFRRGSMRCSGATCSGLSIDCFTPDVRLELHSSRFTVTPAAQVAARSAAAAVIVPARLLRVGPRTLLET